MVDFRFYLITDRHRCGGRPLAAVVRAAVEAGVCAVQLREKDLASGALLALAQSIAPSLGKAALLINDRADVAQAVGARGVHLTERSLPVEVIRRFLPPLALIGVSVHNLAGAQRAQEGGADFILFGPVFETPSKIAYGPPQGVDRLREIARSVSLPLFAVGGITPERAPSCLDAGADGVAAIGAVMAAPDVPRAVAAFREALGGL